MDARPGGSGPPKIPATAPPTVRSTVDDLPGSEADDLADIDAQLAELADLTVAQHVEVFTGIHRRLTSALAVSGAQAAGDATAGPVQVPSHRHLRSDQQDSTQSFQQPSR